MNAEQVTTCLKLAPLPQEGGYFTETYRSSMVLPRRLLGAPYDGDRAAATAIYYLLTPTAWSALHRLKGDEIYHHYLGDPIEMLLLYPSGKTELHIIGKEIANGQKVQMVVPGGVWQGSRLLRGGSWALVGTTMAPGFALADYEHGTRAELVPQFPQEAARITALTRN